MKVERLTPHLGARVSGLDLGTLAERDRTMVRALLEEHLVLFFVGQALDDLAFKAFGEVVGRLVVAPTLPNIGGELEAVQIVETPPGTLRGTYSDAWHSDVSFLEQPPYASILKPVFLPEVGGDTLWASMYAAYEMLSPALQRLADSIEVVHASATRGEFTHPAVRVHPTTGRRGLYVNSLFAQRVVGVGALESAKIIDMLTSLAVVPDAQLRWRWTADVVAMWDNRFTQHYATADYSTPRRMHRVTVVGEPVMGPAPQ